LAKGLQRRGIPDEINLRRNTSSSAKITAILPKMCYSKLAKKSETERNKKVLNIVLIHPFAEAALFLTLFGV